MGLRTLIFILLPICLTGQHTLDQKYERYRDRLMNEYVLIDWDSDAIGSYIDSLGYYEYAGYSLPASGIFPVPKAEQYWEYEYPNCRDNNDVSSDPNVMKWADGTLHLGYYWAVLATDYALAMQRGDTLRAQQSAHELFLALQAYRRLDLTGQRIAMQWNREEERRCDEQIFLTGYSGFFARDDVPRDYYHRVASGGIVSSMACRKEPMDFFKKVGKGNVVSQDQNAMLLFGLAFVNKCIPDEEMDFGRYRSNLRSMARKIAFGIVSHVHESGLRNVTFPECRGGKVQTGGNSIVYAFAMRRALDYLAPNHRIRSTWWDRISWELFAEDIGVVLGKSLGLAKNDNIGMYLTYCVSADMESMNDVVRMSSSASQKEIFPFAKAFIHEYDLQSIPVELKERLEVLLEECPIQGTGQDALNKSDSWHYDNRWRTYSAKPPFNGRGNGLDFMLAANLYRLLYSGS